MRGYACEHERIELLSSGMWNVYLTLLDPILVVNQVEEFKVMFILFVEFPWLGASTYAVRVFLFFFFLFFTELKTKDIVQPWTRALNEKQDVGVQNRWIIPRKAGIWL